MAVVGRLAYSAAFLGAIALSLSSTVEAAEDVTPFLPGTTIGLPVGALPPAGLYFFTQATEFSFNVKNNSGQNIGVHLNDIISSTSFLYIPSIPTILGATYGAFFVQPIRYNTTVTPATVESANGIVNTILSPVNLSWNLQHGFHVSLGAEFYVPDSDYHLNDPVHIGRNYFTFEPSVGLTYLTKDWNISLHPVFDINTTNPANDYKTGTIFLMDYAFLYKINKFELGAGGTIIDQISDDKQYGMAVPEVAGMHGYGNRAKNVTAGPFISYDFGPATLNAYYTRSVYARNTAAGDSYFMTLSLPLGSLAAHKEAREDSGGPRQ